MRIGAVILLILVLFCPAGFAAYTLEESITVAVARISFVDLVQVEMDEEMREKLAGIDLGPAPGKEENRQFSRQYLEYLLRREKVEVQEWEIPGRVTVKTELEKIRGEDLQEKIQHLLIKEIPGVIVEFPRGVDSIFHPRGEIHLDLVLPRHMRVPGNNSLTVGFSVGDEEWEKKRISVFLDREVQVYRVVQDLESGEEITTHFLEKEYVRESDLPRGFLTAGGKLQDYRVRRTVEIGSILCSHHLEEVPLVERGEGVTIKMIFPGFSISLAGEAMESGGAGDNIRVRNLFSGEVVSGEIIGDKLIEIDI